jgi:hypothetical protein
MIVYPTRLLGGEVALLHSGVALALCLGPAALTLLVGQWALRGAPEYQLLAVLAGTTLRMMVVLGAGLALTLTVPAFRQPRFWLWVLAFYLIVLALEIVLIVAGRVPAEKQRIGCARDGETCAG